MAHKRKIEVDPVAKQEGPAPYAKEDLPEKYQDMSWRQWSVRVYARYWYILLCIAIDVMLLLSIRFDLQQPWFVAVIVSLAAVVPEFYLYRKVWGKTKGSE